MCVCVCVCVCVLASLRDDIVKISAQETTRIFCVETDVINYNVCCCGL